MTDQRDRAAFRLYQRAAVFRRLAATSTRRLTAQLLVEAGRQCEAKAALVQPIYRGPKPRDI